MGEVFGPYRLESLLGRGGMGEVWRAIDTSHDNRPVAIKLLGGWLGGDEDFARRFRRECALAAKVASPHVIPIHRYGEIDGRLFIDMPLIHGVDLATLLAEHGPLPPQRAIGIIEQVADALDTAHAAGLIHRDVKPSNILVTARDFTYLIDFGISRAIDGTKLSLSGAVIGTPAYMAPERFDGTGDHRSDIYALGCVLYEALTARQPFQATSLPAYMNAHLNTPPPRPSTTRPDLPPELDQVVARAMAKHPIDRYKAAADLTAAARATAQPRIRDRTKPTVRRRERASEPRVQIGPLGGVGDEITRLFDDRLDGGRMPREPAESDTTSVLADTVHRPPLVPRPWRHAGRVVADWVTALSLAGTLLSLNAIWHSLGKPVDPSISYLEEAYWTYWVGLILCLLASTVAIQMKTLQPPWPARQLVRLNTLVVILSVLWRMSQYDIVHSTTATHIPINFLTHVLPWTLISATLIFRISPTRRQ